MNFTPSDNKKTLPGRAPRAKTIRAAFRLLLQHTTVRVLAGVRSPATLRMQRQHVEYLLERLPGRTPLHQVDARRIARVLEAEAGGRRRRLSGGTLRKRASTLRQALKLAGCRVPRFPDIPYAYQPSADYLPDFDAYQKLRDELPLERRLWFVVATWTGQRAGDVEKMRREDLNVDAGWVRIRSSKTRRFAGARFAAAPELLRELGAHWRELPAGAKLVAAWPHVSSQLSRLSERLELPRTTAHRLRHTFFTWFVQSNGFTPELLELGGWKDLTIPAQVYAHAAPVRLQEQIGRLHRLVVQRLAPQKTSRAVSSRIDTGRREPEPISLGMVPIEMGPRALEAPRAPGPAHDDHAVRAQDGHLDPGRQVDARGLVGAERIELSTNGLRVRCRA
jgi:integrase